MLNLKFRTGIAAILALSMISLAGCSSTASKGDTSAEETDTGGTKTVTLSVLTSNRYLEVAKQKYEAAHPNVKIEIKEYVAAPDFVKTGQMPSGGAQGGNGGGQRVNRDQGGDSGSTSSTGTGGGGQNSNRQGGQGNFGAQLFGGRMDPKDIEKYTTGINTEIMSGKGPDLFSTNYLSYEKYADKKLIANLSDQIKSDSSFKLEDYYANILNSTKVNGSLFSMPIRFQMNMMIANTEALGSTAIDDKNWKWQDFEDVASKLVKDANGDGTPDQYVFTNMSGTSLVSQMLTTSYQKFVDTEKKKANFTSPEFISLLNLAKDMVDKQLVTSERKDRNTNLFQYQSISSYEQFLFTPQFQFDGHAKFILPPSENDNRGVGFSSDLALALNNKSKVKKEAWDFLKFLLSDELQSQRELMGFAVNKKAGDAHLESLKTIGTETDKNKLQFNINGKNAAITPATQADIDRINELIGAASEFSERNLKINDTITAETEPFFSGQKSAEEVAKVLQNKINTFLNE